MTISHNVRRAMVEGGWIRRMFEVGIALKSQYGDDKVFDLSLGNPVVEPPEQFNEALLRLARNPAKGMHRYMPNAGYPETRNAVAQTLTAETGLPFSGGDVVMSCGAAGAINVTLRATLNPGDEVIILSPFFGEYVYYVDNHNGAPVIVPTTEAFQLDLGAIEAAITPRTRGLILNSPNNPSGVIYSADQVVELAQLLNRKQANWVRKSTSSATSLIATSSTTAWLIRRCFPLRPDHRSQLPRQRPGPARGAYRLHRGAPGLPQQGRVGGRDDFLYPHSGVC